MAILKCKMCGGDIELSADKTFGTCEYCGSTMTFPKVDDEQRANMFNRGNHFRRQGEFDRALAVYERIVQEDENDAEAHWCCALCRFGIEYVEDPNTFEYLPTCHRASFDSFLDDVDYLAALEHSDGITKRQYQKDAAKIAEVQRGILATSQNEDPFDVFICYKESENDGSRTRDSLMAQEIYYQLTEQGLRVFFSRITLEEKAGTEYEPYIFAALNSAKVMIVVTTSAEHVNAVWVKNEWSRFLSLMRKDRSKLLLPCYRDMDPYDLPEALSVLQSYDMGKIGFIQDLTRGVNKVLDVGKTKETVRETVVVQQQESSNTAPLLKRAFMFLEDGDFARADEFCEKVLNQDPENAQAYLGKLMAELHVRTGDALKDQPEPFNDRNNYIKVYRFGDEKLKAKLSGDIAFINERNENARLTGIYNSAVSAMKSASSESSYISAAEMFKTISGFKDADSLAEQSLDKAEDCRKDTVYATAMSQMRGHAIGNYEAAIKMFSTIPGWKDSDEQIYACQRKIEEIKAMEKTELLERERQAEEKRTAAKKAAKKRKIVIAIATSFIVACIAFLIVLTTVIIPKQKKEEKYDAAVELYNAGKYDDAISAFEALNGYKDSEAQIEKIKDEKYSAAIELYNAGKYDDAISAFEALNGYKDSEAQIKKCETAIKDEKYAAAIELYNAGKYDDAIAAFEALNGYKDSTAKVKEIYKQLFSDVSVGSTLFFGSYEQDNNTSNGKENIEWLVLARDGDRVLLISRYALDCHEYDTGISNFTWETCSLREWLNGTFLSAAFSEEERAMIPNVTVSADKGIGISTTDQVFLLSIKEVNEYFSSDEARKCAPTAYAIAQGVDESEYEVDGKATCIWWLRSHESKDSDSVSVIGTVVDGDGARNSLAYFDFAVRPALWVSIE